MPLIIGKLFNVISSFQQALIEIRKNKIAENFENEFSEVLDVLKKAAYSRKQLLNKCQELSIEVSLKEKAFLETDKKYKESEILCEKLKEELIKGGKCIEKLGENEVKYKEKISDLELKLFNLENEQDTTVPEKEKAFELEAERERKLLNSRISLLENELKIKDTSEMEVKAKLLETMEAIQKNCISKHQQKIDSLKKLYDRTQEQAQIQIEEFKILSIIMKLKKHQAEHDSEVTTLVKEKELLAKIEKLNNDISVHEDREASMKAKIIEMTSNLAQQKDISSGAITDRKIFCHQYKEMKEHRDQLKQKIDILEGCINDLNQFQNSQTEEINNWKKKWESLDLQNKNLMTKLAQEENDKTAALRNHLKPLEEQIQSYLQIISKKENTIKSLQTKVNYASEECMVLRSQQKTQKKELHSLEEKLTQSEIRISWEQGLYNTLKNGTKLLHLEILRLTNEKNTLMCKVNDLEKLKQNFTYAKQELHHERYKNSALENEMQQPLNVHRWRLLKGTDPEKYELIENFQTIQKQLLRKSVEVEKKDKKLSKMAKVVDQLKGMSSRKKYLEEKCARDANLSELIKEKNNKIKVLSFEINMNETYMSSYQAEISRLKEELRKLKLKPLFKEKQKIAPVLVPAGLERVFSSGVEAITRQRASLLPKHADANFP
ncbi:cilia- and flagella-associated protein 58 [Trichonephila inaurata madagascariensis]|uniref:Cilia- and flagella-associated protein 58 n=1 Tax=Trichonephila inaurata madagascariensis TaxID=2747483 RepID=A0A8X6IPE6_9ARAC|nr:cilia- and flagella-associated protein 58 [Trichonephila inaurata madagascariensis]